MKHFLAQSDPANSGDSIYGITSAKGASPSQSEATPQEKTQKRQRAESPF